MTPPCCPDAGLAKRSHAEQPVPPKKKRPGTLPGPWCVFFFLVVPTKLILGPTKLLRLV
jgi:hypothetical protein